MTEEVFKAPKNKRTHNRQDSEQQCSSPPKKQRTKDDFYTFCTMVLSYTQYEHPERHEELRFQNNQSPLGSGGSTADSYTSETTWSTISTSSREEGSNNVDLVDSGQSEDESWELITCHCMKPYAGRPMIECNDCNVWIHLSCAKIRKSNIPDLYVCQRCRDSKFTTRKSTRTRVESKRITI